MRVILASSSPRRQMLVSQMVKNFEIIVPTKDEDMTLNMSMSKLCETLSLQKAQEVFEKTNGDRVVIGSDCMVSIKGKRLGKPHSREDAVKMLKLLSSRWHSVYTGLCVIIEKNGQIKKYITHDVSKVKFKKLSQEDMDWYLTFDEYKDKAGTYAVQGISNVFVEKIHGNLTTIIGLPAHKLYDILKSEKVI